MKKMYKKPQTEKIPLVSKSETLSFLGGGSNPTEKPSEPGQQAPRRKA